MRKKLTEKKLLSVAVLILTFLSLVGLLWYQVFVVTGLLWWGTSVKLGKKVKPLTVPQIKLLGAESIDIKEVIQELKKESCVEPQMEQPHEESPPEESSQSQEEELLKVLKDPRLKKIKCRCGSCNQVLAECENGNLCSVAWEQVRELGLLQD